MNEKVMRIRDGTRPTAILREILAVNPGISANRLGKIFIEDVPRLSYGVVIMVGRWSEFSRDGCDDETVDNVIIDLMKMAGLLENGKDRKSS